MGDAKPNVLVLGGVQGLARSLVSYLINSDLVSHLRVVDKFAIEGNAATTFIDPVFRKALDSSLVSYQQANLVHPPTVAKVFSDSADPIDYVFDLTGEMRFDRPEIMQIEHTAKLAKNLGTEAAKAKVKAYVRLTYPYYQFDKAHAKESDKKLKPDGDRGVWWHEAVRALGAIPDLNLAVLRIGARYGPFELGGTVVPRIVCGDIYRHLGEKMEFLWNSDLRVNVVHNHDVARALYALASWRSARYTPASLEPLASFADASKLASAGLPAPDAGVRAPLFNLVDESDSTQAKLAEEIGKVFGVKTGFLGGLISAFAKLDIEEMVEDVNEKHLEAWNDMLKASDPPIKDTPLTPYLDAHAFKKTPIALDASKIRSVVGFELKHKKPTPELIQEIVDGFRSEGLWPKPAKK